MRLASLVLAALLFMGFAAESHAGLFGSDKPAAGFMGAKLITPCFQGGVHLTSRVEQLDAFYRGKPTTKSITWEKQDAKTWLMSVNMVNQVTKKPVEVNILLSEFAMNDVAGVMFAGAAVNGQAQYGQELCQLAYIIDENIRNGR